MFTTYEAASRMLRDDDLFVRNPQRAGRKNAANFLALVPRRFRVLANNMISHDGEEHRRLRSIVDKAFQRSHVKEMCTQITTLTNQLLDTIEHSLSRGEVVDLMEHYTRPLPLSVISELLGLPASDRDDFQNWGMNLSRVRSLMSIFSLVPSMWK